MRCEIEVVPCQAPYCVLRVARLTDTACQLADRIRCLDMKKELPALHAWDGNFCVPLELSEIVRVFAMDKRVFVETKTETLLLRSRLYQVETLLDEFGLHQFVRISNSEIVNLKYVQKFDLSFTGIIKIHLRHGGESVVSRRYTPKIRKKLRLYNELSASVPSGGEEDEHVRK